MAFLDKPEDYQALGVEPPSVDVHGSLEELENARKDDHFHEWHQRGIEIYCERGEHRHGRHIPPDHILIGTDSTTGMPLYNVIDKSAYADNYINS